MPFKVFKRLEIPDIILVEHVVFKDHRGFFKEIYKRTDFLANGIAYDFVQANLSLSRRGVVRGLHYQLKPMEQGKLIVVLRGRIFDVSVDIRENSPWFKKYVALELNGNDNYALWIPPGFAHGFQALEDDTLVLYLVTKEYSPQHERCIKWDDPTLSIRWPIKNALVSEKDQKCPQLSNLDSNFRYSGTGSGMI